MGPQGNPHVPKRYHSGLHPRHNEMVERAPRALEATYEAGKMTARECKQRVIELIGEWKRGIRSNDIDLR